jgi:hypothetical protein
LPRAGQKTPVHRPRRTQNQKKNSTQLDRSSPLAPALFLKRPCKFTQRERLITKFGGPAIFCYPKREDSLPQRHPIWLGLLILDQSAPPQAPAMWRRGRPVRIPALRAVALAASISMISPPRHATTSPAACRSRMSRNSAPNPAQPEGTLVAACHSVPRRARRDSAICLIVVTLSSAACFHTAQNVAHAVIIRRRRSNISPRR